MKVVPFLLLWLPIWAYSADSKAVKTDTPPKSNHLAVLDLVDLADNQPRPEITAALRKALSAGDKWMVFSRDTVLKKMAEYNVDAQQGCNNSQCSFDIGGYTQADYVLYGTATFVAEMQSVTLKLLSISTAKIVWSKVLEFHGADGEKTEALDKTFAAAAEEMSSAKLNVDKDHPRKSLAVLDLSENSLLAKVFFERISTRVYGSQRYDLISPSELSDLLVALDINKYFVVPSLENMIGLGLKLGVGSLIYSRVYKDGKRNIYRLAMYDVGTKSMLLEMPPQPSEDLSKLMDQEQTFFNTLFEAPEDKPAPVAVKPTVKSNKALWVSLGVIGALGAGGGAAFYWVENLKKPDTKPPTSVHYVAPINPPVDQ